jgi:hypothetical protein
MLQDHILVVEHTWVEDDSHCDYPSLESLHIGYEARVEVEALAAAVALDSAVEVHVSRHSLEDSHDAPCADAHRLEQTTADTQLVALG